MYGTRGAVPQVRLIVACGLLLVLVSFAVPARGQTVRGILSERDTYAPIATGSVILIDGSADTVAQTLSDEQGYFSLAADEAGDYFLVAAAFGYRSVRSDVIRLDGDEIRVVELDMAPQPLSVQGLDVSVEEGEPEIPGLAGTGFYDRAAAGHGAFLFPGQVLAHPASFTPELFREMHTMVELRPATQGSRGPWSDRVLIRANRAGRTLESRLCEPHIYVDQVRIELMPGEGLEDAVPRQSVEAIEVYRAPFGAPLPMLRDLDPARACGAILIWTRRGGE